MNHHEQAIVVDVPYDKPHETKYHHLIKQLNHNINHPQHGLAYEKRINIELSPDKTVKQRNIYTFSAVSSVHV